MNHSGTSNVSTTAAGRSSSTTSTWPCTAPEVSMASTPRSLARSSGGSACQRASTASHEDASGSTRVGGTRRLTANGRSVAPRMARISSRRSSGRKLTPPRQPSPPASLTAATSGACATRAMPADAMGCSMPRRSVKAVLTPADPPISAPGRSGRSAIPASTASSAASRAYRSGRTFDSPGGSGRAREAAIRSRSRSATTMPSVRVSSCSATTPSSSPNVRSIGAATSAVPVPWMAPSAGIPQLPTRGAVTTKSWFSRARAWVE